MNRAWRRKMKRRGLTAQQIERMEFRVLHEKGQIEDTPYWRDVAKSVNRPGQDLIIDLVAGTILTDRRPAIERKKAS